MDNYLCPYCKTILVFDGKINGSSYFKCKCGKKSAWVHRKYNKDRWQFTLSFEDFGFHDVNEIPTIVMSKKFIFR